MKKFLLLAVALAIGAGPAFGADMPVKAPVMKAPVEPLFSWTGFYLGLNAGAERGTGDIWVDPGPDWTAENKAFLRQNGALKVRDISFTGGGQAGFNIQSGALVFGAEGDFNYLGLRATGSGFFSGVAPVSLGDYFQTEEVKADWLATLRGRLGLTSGKILFYATGGLAVADVKFTQNLHYTGGNGTTRNDGSVSQTKIRLDGWRRDRMGRWHQLVAQGGISLRRSRQAERPGRQHVDADRRLLDHPSHARDAEHRTLGCKLPVLTQSLQRPRAPGSQ